MCKLNIASILKISVILWMMQPAQPVSAQPRMPDQPDSIRKEMSVLRTVLMKKLLRDEREECQALEVRLLEMELTLMKKMKAEAVLPVSGADGPVFRPIRVKDVARIRETLLTRVLRRLHILKPLPRVVAVEE